MNIRHIVKMLSLSKLFYLYLNRKNCLRIVCVWITIETSFVKWLQIIKIKRVKNLKKSELDNTN